jgi:hypothetical protein
LSLSESRRRKHILEGGGGNAEDGLVNVEIYLIARPYYQIGIPTFKWWAKIPRLFAR